jgi:hypothetical protein
MATQQTVQAGDEQAGGGWRIKAAFAIFIASLVWPVVVPVMPLLGFSGKAIAAFSGAMLVIAELMIVAAVAIAGKQGFAYIKAKVFGVLKAYGPPQTVSRTRYIIGLVLFLIPVLLGWGGPYFGHYLPGFTEDTLTYAIAGDVLLLVSLGVLGGDFWDKLRSLFIHSARAVIPEKPAKGGAAH